MAYGRGLNKSFEKRMIDLGRIKNSSYLDRLRDTCVQIKNHFAEVTWPATILDGLVKGKELDAQMLAIQATFKGKLNAVWAEKCRIAVKDAILEQHKRGVKTLFGKFKHLNAVGDKPLKTGERRLLNFPEEWSVKLSDDDVKAMQALATSLNSVGTLDLFRRLKSGQKTALSTPQADALMAMLKTVEDRFGCPKWQSDESVLQLHLDQRCILGGAKALAAICTGLTESITAGGQIPFLVSGIQARGTPFNFVAEVRPKSISDLVDAASAAPRFTSLALEIGPFETIIRGVLTQQPKPYALEEATHILGDDFGLANTSAQSVVKIDRPLDLAFFKETKIWTKVQAKTYLESHSHDGEAVHSVLHDGKDFLSAINAHALHIDVLRSQIDLIYNRIHRIKHEVCRIMGISADTMLDFEAPAGNDTRLERLKQKLQMLLKHVQHLKLLRRGIYRKVDGIKTSWFGWLSTRKAKLARDYKAVVVREDLTVLADEKKSETYLGRRFNKMLNNGSKGQYLRRAREKLRWYGIPEVTVPSFYTSTTDIRFGVVDRKQRIGDVFKAATDGLISHADLHASLTLALYALLRPKTEPKALLAS